VVGVGKLVGVGKVGVARLLKPNALAPQRAQTESGGVVDRGGGVGFGGGGRWWL
jgi:hypothetical protein